MIPASGSAWQVPRWQKELADAVRDRDELLRMLGLSDAKSAALDDVTNSFRLRVPRPFIARMRHGDPDDPLLRQVLPVAEERVSVPGWSVDPLAEHAETGPDGVLQKYAGRALVVTTGACAVHCRYCFRRHFPYSEARAPAHEWQAVIARFAADPSMHEAILSGGDPLSLSDERLSVLVNGLEGVAHLRTLRVHTRQPVVLPSRVDEQLLAWIRASRLRVVFVIHANHAAEIDGDVAAAMDSLRTAGVTLLNQSVLLAGVNDDAATLARLSHRLFEVGVLPYYLHAADAVDGTAHFAVPDGCAVAIHKSLQALLPGYLVPRLVREIPGRPNKELLA